MARRTSELGVRLALGATTRRVVTDVLGETMRVVGIGAMVGWFIAFLVYIHVAPGAPPDIAAFVGVPLLLLLVAAAASLLPARRAGRVDPLEALRQE